MGPRHTCVINSQLGQWRVIAALGKFVAVPHQKFLARMKWFDGVEVYIRAVLASDHVLLLHSAGWIDIAHPVTLLFI